MSEPVRQELSHFFVRNFIANDNSWIQLSPLNFSELKPFVYNKGSNINSVHKTTYWYCHNRNGTGCKFAIKKESFEHNNDIREVFFYKNKHNHEMDESSITISNKYAAHIEANEKIKKELKENNIAPKILLHTLRKEYTTLSTQTLRNKISYQKRQLFAPDSDLTVDIIAEICNKVANGDIIINHAYANQTLFVFTAYKDNLHYLCNNFTLHVDTTFDVFELDSKVMICGITDANCVFHPLASLICNTEDIKSYNYMFCHLLKAFNDVVKKPLAIMCTMSDCGSAVLASLETNFPGVPHKLCWYHILKRLRIKIPEKSDIAMRFYKNLYFLNTITSKDHFEKCFALFKKANDEACTTEQIAYLDMRLYSNINWAECISLFAPCTNNSLESINRHLKEALHHSGRVRFTIGIPGVINYLTTLSKKKFSELPTYTSKETAVVLKDDTIHTFKDDESNMKYTIFIHSSNAPAPLDIFKILKESIFVSLDATVEMFDKFSCVFSRNDISSYRDIWCTCYYFVKHKKCGHCYYMFQLLNQTDQIQQCIEIKQFKKCGRKPNSLARNY